MQRGIASVLIFFFSWLLIFPALASSPDLAVPACCRKDGKHHCTMTHSSQAQKSEPSVVSLAAKCPCCPQFIATSEMLLWAPATAEAVFSGLVRHPAVAAQTEANYRVSHDRSRQKRGPPALILSSFYLC